MKKELVEDIDLIPKNELRICESTMKTVGAEWGWVAACCLYVWGIIYYWLLDACDLWACLLQRLLCKNRVEFEGVWASLSRFMMHLAIVVISGYLALRK